ncbi:hypothetical protein GCM10018793_23690 [Streptomyces sulfonofaciens]|uniref:UDP-glucuronosyltransferase n=1 Tax=Streptomyces sulfonofaciens TaxID=68272 RepID=A0A919KY21_9ACTN|nr:hypothetical protein [Streptomyces sulfonofaciens]GHH76888.1 hypothetical protein GCM10018793_23690 [Streptomyces sulfonofaciens]
MIAVLTSGVALGVHVPGLLLASRLRERGADVRIDVLERHLPADRLTSVAASRKLFHSDFRTARVGQRLASDPADGIPEGARAELERAWEEDGVRVFVVFSGFWLGIVDHYVHRHLADRRPGGPAPRVVICHVDSTTSPSFRRSAAQQSGAEVVWLASAAQGTLPWTIPVDTRPPVPWGQRTGRLLVHGGGWGMGTYQERGQQLAQAGHLLDLVIHERDPAVPWARCFLIEPDWHPWHDDGYPPLARIAPGQSPDVLTYRRGRTHHTAFDLMREARAAVSKPGGGTMLDSLWSATPLVLLEPVGAHEGENARLWKDLGFAIDFEQWRADGFDAARLEPLHRALLDARSRPRDLAAALAEDEESLCSA